MTTDGYVVSPLFFPGGDIGSLAVHGTINDIAMAGARPLYLTASFILEEGFPLADLKRIADTMGEASREAGVPVVAGDTKVVERGKADGVFISTAGVGIVPAGLASVRRSGAARRRRDLSGAIGDHGVAVMSSRENLQFDTDLVSDSAAAAWSRRRHGRGGRRSLRLMRDPTRGGLAATLNEIAQQSGVGVRIEEDAIPIRPEVAAACELLGLDPLYVANEGKLVAVVAPDAAATLLAAMRAHPLGVDAAIIGEMVEDEHRFVQMTTASAADGSSTGCPASNCRASVDGAANSRRAAGAAFHQCDQPLQQRRRRGRAAFYVQVHRDRRRNSADASVAAREQASVEAAVADRHDPFRAGRRVIRALQRLLHVARDRSGDEQHVRMSGRGDEAQAEPFEVVIDVAERVYLQLAAVARSGVDRANGQAAAENPSRRSLELRSEFRRHFRIVRGARLRQRRSHEALEEKFAHDIAPIGRARRKSS